MADSLGSPPAGREAGVSYRTVSRGEVGVGKAFTRFFVAGTAAFRGLT
jgi:hypothetical protein